MAAFEMLMAESSLWEPEERAGYRVFYRIVTSDPPTEVDFLPAQARGRGISKRATVEQRYSWAHCVSVFQTAQQAGETELMMRALHPPRPIGNDVAELWVPA